MKQGDRGRPKDLDGGLSRCEFIPQAVLLGGCNTVACQAFHPRCVAFFISHHYFSSHLLLRSLPHAAIVPIKLSIAFNVSFHITLVSVERCHGCVGLQDEAVQEELSPFQWPYSAGKVSTFLGPFGVY